MKLVKWCLETVLMLDLGRVYWKSLSFDGIVFCLCEVLKGGGGGLGGVVVDDVVGDGSVLIGWACVEVGLVLFV